MKKLLFALPFVGIFAIMVLFCPPTPTPQPTSTPFEMTEVPVMTITPVQSTETPIPPTDRPTPLPVATPTAQPTSSQTFVLEPSNTPTPVNTKGMTFTVTVKSPGGKDTPTPIKKTYFTWTPSAGIPVTGLSCSNNNCGLLIDTDTILDGNSLRIRFINEGSTTNNLNVSIGLSGTNYSDKKSAITLPNSTGEVVFTIPCNKDAKKIVVMIEFGEYTADQYIPYPDCVCK